jgi:hypothetical protein
MLAGGLRGVLCSIVAAGLIPALASPARADVNLGTVGGLTYVSDETAPVPPPGQAGLHIAQCPPGTKLLGGGARIPGFGADAHLNVMSPTTVEGTRGGFGLYFWNQSGAAKTAIAHATCGQGPASSLRVESDETGSAPDALTLKAPCKDGESVSGGGVYLGGAVNEAFVNSSYPFDGGDPGNKPDDGWKARVQNRAGLGKLVTTYAVCSDRAWTYRRSDREILANDDAGYIADCEGPGHLVSGGVKIRGPAGETVLRALSPYDSSDGDLAPDDGFDMNTANDGGDRTATLFAICKR